MHVHAHTHTAPRESCSNTFPGHRRCDAGEPGQPASGGPGPAPATGAGHERAAGLGPGPLGRGAAAPADADAGVPGQHPLWTWEAEAHRMPAVMGDSEPGTLWGDTRRPHSAPPAPLPMATWAPPGRDGGTEPAQHRRAMKAGALGWGPVRGLSARVSTSMPPSRVPEPTAGQRPERDALPAPGAEPSPCPSPPRKRPSQ